MCIFAYSLQSSVFLLHLTGRLLSLYSRELPTFCFFSLHSSSKQRRFSSGVRDHHPVVYFVSFFSNDDTYMTSNGFAFNLPTVLYSL